MAGAQEHIGVRVTETEKQHIADMAAACGCLSVSDYVRRILFVEFDYRTGQPRCAGRDYSQGVVS